MLCMHGSASPCCLFVAPLAHAQRISIWSLLAEILRVPRGWCKRCQWFACCMQSKHSVSVPLHYLSRGLAAQPLP